MMLNTLIIAFVLGFALIVALGHLLLLQAILRGRADRAPPAAKHNAPKATAVEAHSAQAARQKQAA
jgi:hypothetical protein